MSELLNIIGIMLVVAGLAIAAIVSFDIWRHRVRPRIAVYEPPGFENPYAGGMTPLYPGPPRADCGHIVGSCDCERATLHGVNA